MLEERTIIGNKERKKNKQPRLPSQTYRYYLHSTLHKNPSRDKTEKPARPSDKPQFVQSKYLKKWLVKFLKGMKMSIWKQTTHHECVTHFHGNTAVRNGTCQRASCGRMEHVGLRQGTHHYGNPVFLLFKTQGGRRGTSGPLNQIPQWRPSARPLSPARRTLFQNNAPT